MARVGAPQPSLRSQLLPHKDALGQTPQGVLDTGTLPLAQTIGHHGQGRSAPTLLRSQLLPRKDGLGQTPQCRLAVWPFTFAQAIGHHGQVLGSPAGLRPQIPCAWQGLRQMRQRLGNSGSFPLAQPVGHHGQRLGGPSLSDPQLLAADAQCKACQCLLDSRPLALAQTIGHCGQMPGSPAAFRRQLLWSGKCPGQMSQRWRNGGALSLASALIIMDRGWAVQPWSAVKGARERPDSACARGLSPARTLALRLLLNPLATRARCLAGQQARAPAAARCPTSCPIQATMASISWATGYLSIFEKLFTIPARSAAPACRKSPSAAQTRAICRAISACARNWTRLASESGMIPGRSQALQVPDTVFTGTQLTQTR